MGRSMLRPYKGVFALQSVVRIRNYWGNSDEAELGDWCLWNFAGGDSGRGLGGG